MTERTNERHREPGRPQASPSPPRRRSSPVAALHRSIGNRAVSQMLARTPTRTGTVKIGGVGTIKVKGGNLDGWAGKDTFDTVEVTSEKGRHSAKLEKLASASTRTDVTVTIAPEGKVGEELNVGGGYLLEIPDARIRGYAVEDGVETWRVANFENVKRTQITRRVASA